MAQKVGVRIFVKLYPTCYFKGWVKALDWDVRACWPALLAIVKQYGFAGEIGEQDFREWCDEVGVPWEAMSALLGAAILKGAVRIDDGVLCVAKWGEYQSDPTGAVRQARHKAKYPLPRTPSQEETKETHTQTQTVTVGNGANALPPLPTVTGNVCDGGLWKPKSEIPTESARCRQHVRAIHDLAFPPADRTRAIWPQAWNAKVTDAVTTGRISVDTILALLPEDIKAARKLCRDAASWGWGWVEKYLAARSTAPRVLTLEERVEAEKQAQSKAEASTAAVRERVEREKQARLEKFRAQPAGAQPQGE